MTKEELKREAEDFESRKHYRYEDNEYCGDIADGIIQAYLAGAEPKEEQIEHLTKEVNDLENMKATLKSKIADLEQQIEKMKCCKICAYGGNDFGVCYSNKPCKNKNKWKLAKWVNGR